MNILFHMMALVNFKILFSKLNGRDVDGEGSFGHPNFSEPHPWPLFQNKQHKEARGRLRTLVTGTVHW